MDLPKCRTCNERHRLGPCPSTQTSSRGSTEGRAKAETKAQTRHSDSLARDGENFRTAPADGIKPIPRETKPKKEKKNANGRRDNRASGQDQANAGSENAGNGVKRDGAGGKKTTGRANASKPARKASPQLPGSAKKRSAKAKVGSGSKPKRAWNKADRKLARAKGAGPHKRRLAAKSRHAASKGHQLPARKGSGAGLGDVGRVLTPRVGRPLAANKDFTLAATEPWIEMGVSRSTFFRMEKRKRLAAPDGEATEQT